MERLQLTIDLEPTDETYASLIGVATRWCSTVLLVVRESLGLSETGAELMKRLEPYLVARTVSDSWPGTTLLDGTATVSTFRLDPTVVTLLKSAATGLYAWQQPDLPEDLCLLREGGDPWLVTIAHEGDGYVMLERGEFEEIRRDLPDFAAILCEDTDGDA
jgi:hypothetical protein